MGQKWVTAQEQAMDDMRAAKGKPSLKDLSHLTLQPMVFEEEDGTEYRTVLGMSPPFDPRFPNQNQTKNCYVNYLDYHRCRKRRGDDYKPCEFFKWTYKTICPQFWYKNWDRQRSEGIFAGQIWIDKVEPLEE